MSGLKKLLKSNFWGNYLISLSHCVRCKIEPALISDEKAVKRYYKKKMGRDLDLQNPKTFNEKINWSKIYNKNPLMQQCADKVAVRDYILKKGYGDCLNEVYGVYDRVKDIDFSSLPNQFVIKAAHGSNMNYIVKNKKDFDWKHAKKMMNTWLHQDIYWSGREWVYKEMPKRIIIEKYLEDDSTGELRDYKFYCFNGFVKALLLATNRQSKTAELCFDYFDDKFNHLALTNHWHPNAKELPKKPSQFEEMISIAQDLSKGMPHVRIDLYEVNGKIYFGECTFFDAGGALIIHPEQWDKEWGDLFILPKE